MNDRTLEVEKIYFRRKIDESLNDVFLLAQQSTLNPRFLKFLPSQCQEALCRINFYVNHFSNENPYEKYCAYFKELIPSLRAELNQTNYMNN